VGGQPFSVHAEGERVILTGAQGRQEVELVPPRPQPEASGTATWPEPVCAQGQVVGAEEANAPAPAPGTSPLDEAFPPTSEEGGAS
jgi:hypothetical protein